jgi:hypothetical protein
MNPRNLNQSKNIFGEEIIDIFIVVRDSSKVNKKFTMKINRFDKLYTFKQKIRDQIQIETANINLLSKGKFLKGEHKMLRDFKIEAKQVRFLIKDNSCLRRDRC